MPHAIIAVTRLKWLRNLNGEKLLPSDHIPCATDSSGMHEASVRMEWDIPLRK